MLQDQGLCKARASHNLRMELKERCIRWVTLRYDENQKAPPYEKWISNLLLQVEIVLNNWPFNENQEVMVNTE